MKPSECVIRSRRVVLPDGVRPASVHIRGETIAAVRGFLDTRGGGRVHDFGELVVMPGLVDTHVHINEPGRADWEGFATATHAAAAGGVTTLIEMPLNSVPATTSVAAFKKKLRAASGKLQVDVGFWGGVVPGNARELPGLFRAGVFGFKCFLVPSGVPEFEYVNEKDLRHALPVLKKLDATLLVHAELPGPIEKELRHLRVADPRKYRTWLLSRPPAAETGAVALMIRLCREYGVRTHIVHVSAAGALPLLRRARKQGLPISGETCPHYLYFAGGAIPDGCTQFKCAPPIRDAKNRDALWEGLRRGTLDCVVTDHSPSPPEMKRLDSGDFLKAWGGIASLQLGLAAVWTEAAKRGLDPAALARWMCHSPARLAGLAQRKGAIAPGCDADIVVWDSQREQTVEPGKLLHRHKLTPYALERLRGVVEKTFLRGQCVYDGREFPVGAAGRVLLRGKV